MTARASSTASMRAVLVVLVVVTACEGPSRRVIRAKPNAPPVTVAAPNGSRVTDVPAGDSATFGGREYLAGDTVFSFADYHTATADFVQLERSDRLIPIASLVLPVRYKDSMVLHACTLDGKSDPEILALYPDEAKEPDGDTTAVSPTANALVHPRFAWRASRSRERFETVDPKRVLCSFADVVD